MAFTLSLTDNTTTNALGAHVIGYSPQSAPDDQATITETITLRIGTGSVSTARTAAQAVGKMLNDAARWANFQTAPRVYLLFEWAGSDGVYRSPVYGGSITPGPDVLSRAQLVGGYFEFLLTITRANWWEANTEVQLETPDDFTASYPVTGSDVVDAVQSAAYLSNVTKTDAANGVLTTFTGSLSTPFFYEEPITIAYTVGGVAKTGTYPTLSGNITVWTINRDTGAYTVTFDTAPDNSTNVVQTYKQGSGNRIVINSGVITGDLPAPLNVSLQVPTAIEGGNPMQDVWLGGTTRDFSGDYTTMPFTSGGGGAGTTPVADASALSGTRVDVSCTTSEVEQWTYSNVEALVPKASGGWYALFMAFINDQNTGQIDNVYYRFRIYLHGTSTKVFETEQIKPATDTKTLHQMALIQLPPWHVQTSTGESTTPAEYDLTMSVQSASGTVTVSLDWLQLLPVEVFTAWTSADTSALSDTYTIDTSTQQSYITSAGGKTRGTPQLMHAWPTAWPGVINYYYITFQGAPSLPVVNGWNMYIGLSYRPRRRSI